MVERAQSGDVGAFESAFTPPNEACCAARPLATVAGRTGLHSAKRCETRRRTSRTGVFALNRQWPSRGKWTLAIGVAQGPDDRVYAIVDLSPAGEVAGVRVPTPQQNGYTIPAPLAMSEIDTSLRARALQLANK